MKITAILSALIIGISFVAAQAHEDPSPQIQEAASLAPGYGALQFQAPLPGSYELPPLGFAENGEVINSENNRTSIHTLLGDKIVLLSFIYATCDDVNGCPLATMVFHRIARQLKKNPELADKLRLITLSFDPEKDTPNAMKRYGQSFRKGNFDWHFLTTESESKLAPILKDYKQTRQTDYNDQGEPVGTYSHTLRVYLIDQQKQIRNIYSVAYLHPDILLSDVKTLLLESGTTVKPTIENSTAQLHGTGDDRSGYDNKDYQSTSDDLQNRVGKPVELIELINKPPLGLPPVPQPENNIASKEKVDLGRKLFFDRRLSLNNTFSCAMCHVPEQGFTSNEMALAVGIEGRTVRRNSPTLYNVGYATKLFHDGREDSLERQVWGPLLAANEMGNPSLGFVINKIKKLRDYKGLFEQAFSEQPNIMNLGQAMASYQRSLNSANSPFDRWYYGNEAEALPQAALSGFRLFTGKARCVTCHTIGTKTALFTDNKLHNTGHGFKVSMERQAPTKKVLVAPGHYLDIPTAVINSVGEKKPNDVGLYEITEDPADRWKYKTPTLRNINLTAPYMHDGAMASLREVVEFYNAGGVPNENLDPLMQPLALNEQEIDDLVSFLKSLTGDNVDSLISDAFAAPVGDPN